MEPWLIPLVAFALAATAAYYLGRKKNRWMAGWISRESEEALRPRTTDYVNIGGAIGYNYTYAMPLPYGEAKGTFTLLPRHSFLYYPISLLVARHDRYYLQLFTPRALLGEGHIVREDYFRRARSGIAGVELMKSSRLNAGGRNYILLWDKGKMKELLEGFLKQCAPFSGQLLHACCYGPNRNFYFYLVPVMGRLKGFLEMARGELEAFFAEGKPKRLPA